MKRFFAPGRNPSVREFESFLRASGLSCSQAKGVVACGYRALAQTAGEDGDDAETEALKRFNKNLKQAAADNIKAVAGYARWEEKETPCDAELLRLFNASLLRAAEDNLIKAGFNPAQARDDAGKWTDTGGGGGGSSRPPLPTRRPSTPDEPGLGHPLSPLDFIGGGVRPLAGAAARALKPVASEIVGGVTAARNAIRLRGYLSEARQLPNGVAETSAGTRSLTLGQQRSLKEFTKKHSKFKENMVVARYSDGRAIYSIKHPAKDVPGSYAIWEKQVDSAGKVIRVTKTTVGPGGELVHTKKY